MADVFFFSSLGWSSVSTLKEVLNKFSTHTWTKLAAESFRVVFQTYFGSFFPRTKHRLSNMLNNEHKWPWNKSCLRVPSVKLAWLTKQLSERPLEHLGFAFRDLNTFTSRSVWRRRTLPCIFVQQIEQNEFNDMKQKKHRSQYVNCVGGFCLFQAEVFLTQNKDGEGIGQADLHRWLRGDAVRAKSTVLTVDSGCWARSFHRLFYTVPNGLKSPHVKADSGKNRVQQPKTNCTAPCLSDPLGHGKKVQVQLPGTGSLLAFRKKEAVVAGKVWLSTEEIPKVRITQLAGTGRPERHTNALIYATTLIRQTRWADPTSTIQIAVGFVSSQQHKFCKPGTGFWPCSRIVKSTIHANKLRDAHARRTIFVLREPKCDLDSDPSPRIRWSMFIQFTVFANRLQSSRLIVAR